MLQYQEKITAAVENMFLVLKSANSLQGYGTGTNKYLDVNFSGQANSLSTQNPEHPNM